MSYDEELKAWCESLAIGRPDGLVIVMEELNPALAQVTDLIEAKVPRDSSVWVIPGMVLTYVGFESLEFLQICIMGAMLNAVYDAWKVNGFATIYAEPPTPSTPFTTLEIEIPVLPGRQRMRNHPSNEGWRP